MEWGTGLLRRLYSMKQESERRNNDCRAIVLRKKNIIEEALKAAGITFIAARASNFSFDDDSYFAGCAAGERTSLNAGELHDPM